MTDDQIAQGTYFRWASELCANAVYVYKTASVVWITALLHDPLIENLDYWFEHLQAIFFNRLIIKVQNPVENNRAKSPSSLWKSVPSSSISFVVWKRQRLDVTRDPFFSAFLVIILQYEGPTSGSTALLKPEVAKKTLRKEPLPEEMCVPHTPTRHTYTPRQTSRAATLDWGLHSAMQPRPPLLWMWLQATEVNTSPSKAVLLFTLKLWSSCFSEETTV